MEVVVAGPRHLLLESSLAPILEIRWQQGSGRQSVDSIIDTIIHRTSDREAVLRPISLPEHIRQLALPHLRGLSWHDDLRLDGLVWQCPTCQTVIFCHLTNRQQTGYDTLLLLLQTVRCHLDTGQERLWSVQDFRLTLPAAFTFVDSSFAAGLSRLAFSGCGLKVQYCRLAFASARLAQMSLGQLLTEMLGCNQTAETVRETATLCEMRTQPSFWGRLHALLARRPVFSWGRIWHDAAHNRLLAIVAHGKQPIAQATVQQLAITYEILPRQ